MTTPRRAPANSPAAMKHADHQRLWRLVEGAVVDALRSHPEYLTAGGEQSAVQSITKRVVGALVGHAEQTRKGGRLGGCSGARGAADHPYDGCGKSPSCGLGVDSVQPVPSQVMR